MRHTGENAVEGNGAVNAVCRLFDPRPVSQAVTRTPIEERPTTGKPTIDEEISWGS
jgi:hypothetical protein